MPISYTQELSCKICGKIFIFRNYEKELFDQQGFSKPKLCPVCRKTERELREREIERIEVGVKESMSTIKNLVLIQ